MDPFKVKLFIAIMNTVLFVYLFVTTLMREKEIRKAQWRADEARKIADEAMENLRRVKP